MNVVQTPPRILLLIDKFGWAFHTIANAIAYHLSDRYACTILAASDAPEIDTNAYDILHVFGGDQTYHHHFPKGRAKILKSVYSHLWLKHHFKKEDFYKLHLRDADAITVPSMLLLHELHDIPLPVYLFPEGVDTGTFTPLKRNTGPLIAGWAGNPADPLKNVHIAKQACDGICELRIADGSLLLHEMVEFYNSIDVLLCTSTAEGCPRPVLEAMACGKYPVAFPVGIVPEVLLESINGCIVQNRSTAGMRSALTECTNRLADIRTKTAGVQYVRAHRQWRSTVWNVADAYEDLLRQ